MADKKITTYTNASTFINGNKLLGIQSGITKLFDANLFVKVANNLSEVTPATARTNLDVYSKGEVNVLVGAGGTLSTKTIDYTFLDDDGINTLISNPDTADQRGTLTDTLPTVADNSGREITIFHGTNNGLVILVGEGAETIRYKNKTLTGIKLLYPDDFVKVKSNGTAWNVTGIYSHLDTGRVNRSDYTNVHIGNGVTYDNGSGTSTKNTNWTGMTITESVSGITATVILDTSAGVSGTLYFGQVTGVGYFTNNRVLTASNGQTIDVNEATGGVSKNIDYNLYHGFGVYGADIRKTVMLSTDSTEANETEMNGVNYDSSGASPNRGYQFKNIDTNYLKLQTATSEAFGLVLDDGTVNIIDTDDYYVRVILEMKL